MSATESKLTGTTWGGSLRGLSAGLKNQTVWVRLPPAPPKTHAAMFFIRKILAQMVERLAFNLDVVGSTPTNFSFCVLFLCGNRLIGKDEGD